MDRGAAMRSHVTGAYEGTCNQSCMWTVHPSHGRCHGCLQSEKQKRQKLQQQRSELASTVQKFQQFYQGSSPNSNVQVLRARHCLMHELVQQLEQCFSCLEMPAAVEQSSISTTAHCCRY